MNIIEKNINEIKPDSEQPRKTFDEETIEGMAETIKRQGIIQPIEIDEKNQIIVGERRWRASKIAGIQTIPCIIQKGLTAEQKLERQLIEDIQDEPLPMRERDLAWWNLYALKYPAQCKELRDGNEVQGKNAKISEFSKFLGISEGMVRESFERVLFARRSDVDIYQFTPTTVARTKGLEDDDRIQLLKKAKEKDWSRDKVLKTADIVKKSPDKIKRIILDTDVEPEMIEPVLELKDEKKQMFAIQRIQETHIKPKEIVDFLKDKNPDLLRGSVGIGVLSQDQWHSEMSTAFDRILRGMNSWNFFIGQIKPKDWADDLKETAILVHNEIEKVVIKNGKIKQF